MPVASERSKRLFVTGRFRTAGLESASARTEVVSSPMIQAATTTLARKPFDPTDTSGFAVGIDIGGTSTKFGFVDPNGEIIARDAVDTAALEDPMSACKQFRRFADEQIHSLRSGE